MKAHYSRDSIVFGGGCFWCTEAVFKMLRGVQSVESGYTGGSTTNPLYEDVSLGNTGHVESVRVSFDSELISLNDLLTVFFATHDPTVRNRQGNDVGTQYRSAIFYSTSEQRKEIEMFIANLNTSSVYGDPIVTEVKPLTVFYPAESYHQNYYVQNSKTSYCEVIINPKLQKVQEQFAQLLKSAEEGS